MRVKGVTSAANAVLHPWLQQLLTEALASRAPVTAPEVERPVLARWQSWLGKASCFDARLSAAINQRVTDIWGLPLRRSCAPPPVYACVIPNRAVLLEYCVAQTGETSLAPTPEYHND